MTAEQIIQRRVAKEIYIGQIPLGGGNPVRIQSMTNIDTMNTQATVEQIIRLVNAGCEYVRLAVPTTKEAQHLAVIKDALVKQNCQVPLIADIHFNPKAAEIAAQIVEKVRINPGNYVDKKTGKVHFTEQEYQEELLRIQERLSGLLEICQKHKTVIRIGTNHGSLSERIMSRYGDTPEGMAQSAFEFAQICESLNFKNLVFSMKASNVKVMVQSTRLLVNRLDAERMNYPIHLGVTEAGDGDDGRIKSAAGIGSLLLEGIGDTIRVSLTEAPEKEIPVAKSIVHFCKPIHISCSEKKQSTAYEKRETTLIENIGGENAPVVLSSQKDEKSDYYRVSSTEIQNAQGEIFPVFETIHFLKETSSKINFFHVKEINQEILVALLQQPITCVLIANFKTVEEDYQLFDILKKQKSNIPVIIQKEYVSEEECMIKGSAEIGSLLVNGLGDGVGLGNRTQLVLDILQATGTRISKAEFIACPSCGRTLYDIVSTLQVIKENLAHLKGIKIGVMGCIVNGPGEMADAHYGYVGSGNGKITLYKGKELVKRDIEEAQALNELIALIKENGDWVEKE